MITAVRRDRQSPVMGTLGLVTLVLASLARAEDGATNVTTQLGGWPVAAGGAV